jgi:hypothetical protein
MLSLNGPVSEVLDRDGLVFNVDPKQLWLSREKIDGESESDTVIVVANEEVTFRLDGTAENLRRLAAGILAQVDGWEADAYEYSLMTKAWKREIAKRKRADRKAGVR